MLSNKKTSQTSGKILAITAILSLLLCLLILAFLFQGSRGIWQPDEGYYVGTAITMLNNSDMLIPHLDKEVFLEKPPMIYWGIIAGLKLLGHTEFAARAFHALCYIATTITVGLLGYSLFGTKLAGVTASFIYATMVLPFIAANFVTPDTPLVLWTTLTVLFFWKSVENNGRFHTLWKLLMCTAVGIGFLCKGPAVLIPCGGLFVFLVIKRQVIKYFFRPWILAGFLIFCCVGLSWYFYVSFKVPGAGLYFLDNQIWGRLVSEKYNRNPGIIGALIYLPVIIFGSLPWSAEWFKQSKALLAKVSRKSWWLNLPNQPSRLLLICCFFVPLLLLCMASSKLGLYALPLFPFLALATSQLWTRKILLFLPITAGEKMKKFVRPTALTLIWLILLLTAKFALAYYPTRTDTRALWAQLRNHIPDENYEIITIDERADGLLFYGAVEVENVTKKNRPYPTFVMPEYITEEIKDIPVDNHPFLFLVRKSSNVALLRQILGKSGIVFEEITLPYERTLLICKSSGKQRKT